MGRGVARKNRRALPSHPSGHSPKRRPLPGRDFEFKFYFDLRIPAVRPDLPDLLAALAAVSEDFRLLGAYSELV